MKLTARTRIVLSFVTCLALSAVALSSADAFSIGILKETGLGKELGGENVNLAAIISQIVKTLLKFLATVAVLLILYGGFTWMTAGGDTKKVDTAKSILKNSIIGLIIILCSYAITVFVFDFALQAIKGGDAGSTGSGAIPTP